MFEMFVKCCCRNYEHNAAVTSPCTVCTPLEPFPRDLILTAVRLIYGSKFKNYVRSYLNFSSLSWVSLSWRAGNLGPRQKTYRLIKIILVYRAAETFSEEQLFALTGN